MCNLENQISEKRTNQRNHFFFNADMHSAVCNESWNTYGTRTGKQLWNCCHGSVCGGCKDRCFCIYACADFGNAFSTFIAQNYGAKEKKRIQQGLKAAVRISAIFCVVVSAFVYIFAKPLMMIFVDAKETAIIMEGVRYLRIEGAFYIGIGWLFLLYGLYRALGRPGMSVVLTVFSLGTRVALAYILSAIQAIGVVGIWWSVPIGWALADIVGLLYYKIKKQNLVEKEPEM